MGVVYRAEHARTGAAVALKTVRSPSEALLASIRREMRALERLRHPGITRIVDTGIFEGLPWYAMELLEGETLRGAIQRLWLHSTRGATQAGTAPEKTVPLETESGASPARLARHGLSAEALTGVLSVLRTLCTPLAFLHGEGLVHRDLKPDNVFIRKDGRPVLVDLGIVASFGGARSREELSAESRLMGSWAYTAPEQLRSELVDARADLYAFGCMLYECLTGRPPFTGSTGAALRYQHLSEPAVAPSLLNEGIPEELDRLVLRLLEKRPEHRLGYAEDVAQALGTLSIPAMEFRSAPSSRTYLYRPGLAGRAEVLDELDGTLGQAPHGGREHLVLLRGESGVGKTRVAMEAARRAAQQGLTVCTGQCAAVSTEGEAGMPAAPLHPFRPLLRMIADRCREGGGALAERMLGPHGRLLALFEPSLAELPGVAEQPEPPALPSEAARRRVLDVLAQTLLAFAQVHPLLLVLDDLQWADELSLDVLKALAAKEFHERGLVILGTYRVEEPRPELTQLAHSPGVRDIALGRLDEASIGAMVSGMLALSAPPADLVGFLRNRSNGNPFFIAEYLRAAIGEGLLFRDSTGTWRLRERAEGASPLASSVPLPLTVAEIIERRLSALGQAGYGLVERASVLGREFDGEVLAATAGLSDAAMSEALEALRVRQIIEETASGRLRFVHDKLREIAYGRIASEQRRALHRSAGLALEPRSQGLPDAYPDLGHHFSQAGIHSKASQYLGQAADRARAAYANGEAIRLYRAALQELEELDRSGETAGGTATPAPEALHERLGDLLALSGRQEEARASFEAALAHVNEHPSLPCARLHRKIGKTWETHHAHDEALQGYERAERDLGAPGPGATEAWWAEWVQLRIDRISVYYWLGQVEHIRPLVDEVRPVVRERGTALQRAHFFHVLTQMNIRAERYLTSVETVSYARACLAAAEESGDDTEVAEDRFSLAAVLMFHGALAEAEQQMRTTLREAERQGSLPLQSRCLTYLTVIHRKGGRVEQTRQSAQRSLGVAEAGRMVIYQGAAKANLAWADWRDGDPVAAEKKAREALALWKGPTYVFPLQWMALLPLLAMALEQRHLAEAVAHAQALLDSEQQGLPRELTEPLTQAIAAWEQGNAERSQWRLRQSITASTAQGYV
ncbi:AAA family ATPase [Pyxidicoccus parkwayensis]|uniref:AAA family ATPase n=2 Tax=Pyxidicoccus parkwayensis TaxID=2813578 RepID=A0ABX7NNL1_9BACT|nr:AAA family ATPase [Pyxidicoccus parkwaysis]